MAQKTANLSHIQKSKSGHVEYPRLQKMQPIFLTPCDTRLIVSHPPKWYHHIA